MLLIAKLRRASADLADRLFQLSGLEVLAAALIALVAACLLAAVGADTLHIAVGKEHLTLRAVTLAYRLLIDMPVLDEFLNNLGRCLMIHRVVGHTESVEEDAHLLKRLVKVRIVALRHLTRRHTLGFGADDYRRSVIV